MNGCRRTMSVALALVLVGGAGTSPSGAAAAERIEPLGPRWPLAGYDASPAQRGASADIAGRQAKHQAAKRCRQRSIT